MAFTWTAAIVEDDGDTANRFKKTGARRVVYKLTPDANYETNGAVCNCSGEIGTVAHAYVGTASALNASTVLPWVSVYSNAAAVKVKVTSITNIGAELANNTSLGAVEVFLVVCGTNAD